MAVKEAKMSETAYRQPLHKRVGMRLKTQTTKEEIVGRITAVIKGDVDVTEAL